MAYAADVLARQLEFQCYSRKTRREQFLEEMDAVMPWSELTIRKRGG
jgi:hypothetical protein